MMSIDAGRKLRIFVIEDHDIMRELLREFIGREEDMEIVDAVPTGTAGIEWLKPNAADMVLIDLGLPDMSGVELIRALRVQHPDLVLAALTAHGEQSYLKQAIEAGVNGYVLKSSVEEIVPAIRHIMRGERYVSPVLHREDSSARRE